MGELQKMEVVMFNGGMNNIRADHDIADNQAASCYNVYNDDLQGITTRWGYEIAVSGILAGMTGTGDFVGAVFGEAITSSTVSSISTNLVESLLYGQDGIYGYKVNTIIISPTTYYPFYTSAVVDGTKKIRTAAVNNELYILDGGRHFARYDLSKSAWLVLTDGTEFYGTSGDAYLSGDGSKYNYASAGTPYVPKIYIKTQPNGTSGQKYEELNFLTPRFKQSFNGDGTTTAFQMSLTSLTPGDNTVIVGTTTYTSGASSAGYTVNYASGIFNLTTAPTTGFGNIEIETTMPYTSAMTRSWTFVGNDSEDVFHKIFKCSDTRNYNFSTIASAPTVTVSGVVWTSGAASAGFTVNLYSGVVSLSTGIGTAATITVTAVEYFYDRNYINKCEFMSPYSNGNVVNLFVAGNVNTPSRVWWSATDDPTYFPATSYVDVDTKNELITGFLPHANSLLIFKEKVIYVLNGTVASANMQINEIYRGEGCIATDSLQLINGYPTFVSQRGVVQLQPAGIGYNLTLISEEINGITGKRSGIMTETYDNRRKAIGALDEKRYYLYLNGQIWVYEYNLTHSYEGRTIYPWIPWKTYSINGFAKSSISSEPAIYFAGTNVSGSGAIYKFNLSSITDDGAIISSYWLSKQFHIGETYDIVKRFEYQIFHMRAYDNVATSVVTAVTYVEGEGGSIGSASIAMTMTPDTSVGYTEVDTRHFIHYNGKSVQFSIAESSTSGGFTLLGTKFLFYPVRRIIYR